jgi:broad specificity phosphatase PhoE
MTLTAVRHGQASFGSADYDVLSTVGWTQSQRLGEWLAGHERTFDHVVCGDLRRHRETVEAIAKAYQQRGLTLPSPIIESDLNEFDHAPVVAAFLEENPTARATMSSGERPSQKAVMDMLLGALGRWTEGSYDDRLREGWAAFGTRVQRGSDLLCQMVESNDVLLISSGGTLARMAQRALEAPDRRAVELNLSLRNSGLCEFHRLGGALRVGSWNALPHLAEQRELWTYF